MAGNQKSRFEWAQDFWPTPAEFHILKAAAAGKWAHFGETATIRGEFLRILLLGVRDDWPVAPAGVRISASAPADKNAPRSLTIKGGIDLIDARAADGKSLPALYIRNAAFDGIVHLTGAHLKNLYLAGCHSVGIKADNLRVSRNIRLDDSRCEKGASFIGSQAGGHFIANGAMFETSDGPALNLQGAAVKGGVFLRNATAKGGVNASGLVTDGQFSAKGATFENLNGKALNLQSAAVKGGVFLDSATAKGGVHAGGLVTDEQFSAKGATFETSDGDALNLQGAAVKGGVFLDNATAKGGVNASGLVTDGQFSANGAIFENPDGEALNLQGAAVKGGVFLRNATAKGGVNASGLVTDGQFSAEGAMFENLNGKALNLQSAMIKDGVYLLPGDRPASFIGCFFAPNAVFSGLYVRDAQFDSGNQTDAIDLRRAKVTEHLWIDDTTINGDIDANGLTVEGEARLNGLKPGDDGKPLRMFLRHAQINGVFVCRNFLANAKDKKAAFMDLSGAHIERIEDDIRTGWPEKVLFDRLTYNSIQIVRNHNGGAEPRSLFKQRCKWLLREYDGGKPKRGEFNPQPFEQLAKVLRAQGEGETANLIAAEKQRHERRCAERQLQTGLNLILDLTSQYGYSPARALICFFGWVLIGGFAALMFDVFHPIGFEPELIVSQPTSNFEPFVYALDLVTPLVDFGQAPNYRIAPVCLPFPSLPIFADRAWCQALEWAEGIYSIIGYVLFSILVLTLTGILRRD